MHIIKFSSVRFSVAYSSMRHKQDSLMCGGLHNNTINRHPRLVLYSQNCWCLSTSHWCQSQILMENWNFCLLHQSHSMPPLGESSWNIAITFGMEKLRNSVAIRQYQMVKNFWRYHKFIGLDRVHKHDRQMDTALRHSLCLCIALRC